jgi:hypothetical protein
VIEAASGAAGGSVFLGLGRFALVLLLALFLLVLFWLLRRDVGT